MSPMPLARRVLPAATMPAESAALCHELEQWGDAERGLDHLLRRRRRLHRHRRQPHQADEERNNLAHSSSVPGQWLTEAELNSVGFPRLGRFIPRFGRKIPLFGSVARPSLGLGPTIVETTKDRPWR